LKKSKDKTLAEALAAARFNLDVVVGLTDHDRVAKLVQGRNRSVQVKEWSLKNFKGDFSWLAAHVDRKGGPFAGKVGWEENSPAPVTVLDIISLMTLFHPAYGGQPGRRLAAPTVAFSSKGTADNRLINPDMAPGYRTLLPVLDDIIRLHDYVYANFQPAYDRYKKEYESKSKARLGGRKGIVARQTVLPLTETVSDYQVDKGLLFPLLAAHRALLQFDGEKAKWKTDPEAFFDQHGPELVGLLFDEYEKLRGNPAATGKNRSVYVNLHTQARLLLADDNL
jgi:hypothetical protein